MDVLIEHIDDILPHLPNDGPFRVYRRKGYVTVDYAFIDEGAFSNTLLCECRGLKFNTDGSILARPLHKFFNYGEKSAPQSLDWSTPVFALEKRDGTMVHPAQLNGNLVWMTRMGMTEQAESAQAYVTPEIAALSTYCLNSGQTPIFEYTGPDNRIVIDYTEPQLTLLAIRDIRTGQYMPYTEIVSLAARFDTRAVASAILKEEEFEHFILQSREATGIEGYVVVFDDGTRIKIKSTAYTLRHRALSSVTQEKVVLSWVCKNIVDDILPLVSPELADRILDYQKTVLKQLDRHHARLESFRDMHKSLSRKAYAERVNTELPVWLRPAAFKLLGGADVREFLMEQIANAATTQTRVDDMREAIGTVWDTEGLTLPEHS